MVFRLVFASKTILSWLFYQIFIVATKLAIPTVIPTKEAKAEIEIHLLTVETKISQCSVQFKIL